MIFAAQKSFLPTLLAITCLQSPLWANKDEDGSYREFLSGSPCTEEQRAKIRFAVESGDIRENTLRMGSSQIHYKIHNGTDRKIAGIVIAVTFKNPDSGKVETLDVFSDFTLIPASCGFGNVRFYYPNLAALEPKFSLKEVRLIEFKD